MSQQHQNQRAPSDESIIDLDLEDLEGLEDRWEEVGPTVYDALFLDTRPDDPALHTMELDEDMMTRLNATLSAIPLAALDEDSDASLIRDLDLIDSILQTSMRAIEQPQPSPTVEVSSSLRMPVEDDAELLDDADIEEILDPLGELDYRRTIAERSMELEIDDAMLSEMTSPEIAAHGDTRPDAGASMEDIGFLDSGIFEIDDVSRALRISVRAPVLDAHVEQPQERRQDRRQLLLRAALDAAGRMELREPWLSWVSQARQEIMAQSSHSAEEIGALAARARISAGAASPTLTALEVFASELGPQRRDLALYQLGQRWQGPRDEIARTLDALGALDEGLGTAQASARHASVALARVAEDLLRAPTQPSDALTAWLERAPSSSAFAMRALLAHRAGDRHTAAAAWRDVVPYAHPNDRDALMTHAAVMEARAAAKREGELGHADADGLPTGQLRVAQHVLAWRGERVHEALVIRALLAREQDEHDPAMLAALFTRLGWLSRAWARSTPPDRRLGEHTPLELRARAAARAARSLLHARLWEVEARAMGDMVSLQSALERQLELVREPAQRALLWEQLACVHQATGTPETIVRACLNRALDESPDCLPALLGLGHIALARQDWAALLSLRAGPSVGESEELDQAWRRADLLWRTGGDTREILSMIRTARLARPDDPHLYLMMLRGLASVSQWRGIAALAESCRQEAPALAQMLRETGLDPAHSQLAVELYLEDAAPPAAQLVEAWQLAGGGLDLSAEEGLFWRITAQDVAEREPMRALARLEAVPDPGTCQAATIRRRLWRLYLTGWQLRQPERGREDWRALLHEATSPLLRRFALHGLLRTQDAAWMAEHMSAEQCAAWLEEGGLSPAQAAARVGLLRAELYALAACPEDACETLITEAEHTQDPALAHHARERAVGIALHARLWDELALLLSVALPPAERTQRAGLLVQLAACADIPHGVEELDIEPLWSDPLTALAGLEGTLRRQERGATLAICDAALSAPRRRPQYQSALHMLALICAEGHAEDAELERRIAAWSAILEPDASLAQWICGCAALRLAQRRGVEADIDAAREALVARFGEEARVSASGPPAKNTAAALIAWAEGESSGAMGLVRAMAQREAALRRWVVGERSRLDAPTLVDLAATPGDPTGLIALVACLALRATGQHASMERQLTLLAERRELAVLSLWARVRQLLHLAMTQGCEEDALAQCDDPALVVDVPWLSIWRGLLLRALGRGTLEPLTSAEPDAHSACELELSGQDSARLMALTQRGVAGAIVQLELKAAVERRDWRPELGLELTYAAARGALAQAPQQEALGRFMRLAGQIEAGLLGSPWCPMRLVQGDLTRLGVGTRELEVLSGLARGMEGAGPLAEWRLVLARQWMRLGQRSGAMEGLLPPIRHDLVTRAWALLLLSIDPLATSETIQTWQAARWSRLAARGEQGDELLSAALTWELGRTLEACGRAEDASRAWRHALTRAPSFGPALAMLGRALIQAQDWFGLAALWEETLANTEEDKARLGLHLRLAWIYERTLAQGRETLERALWHHQKALAIDPTHAAAIHASWRLAHQVGEHEALAVALGQLSEATQERELRVAALAELGAVEEHLLGDRERAISAYNAAWEQDTTQLDALWGLLQLTPWGSEQLVRQVEGVLERGAPQPTRDALGDWLCLIAAEQPRASYMLEQRFGGHLVWRLSQLGRALERGELDEEALEAMRQLLSDEQLRGLMMLLELQHTSPPPGRAEQERLERLVAALGAHPWAEGMLVAALARASAARDLDALAGLHGAMAGRATSPLEEGLAWLHVILARAWAGHIPTALQVCEKLLERLPELLPAVRLAGLLSEQLAQWASLARWCQREADLTSQETHASACRVKASEVQRRYLGDLAAASDQLRMVLQQDPTHAEAFERLRQLLIQRGEVRQLIQISERWLPRITSRDRRIELLNELADLSLNHLQDNTHAIRYLSQSLQEEPRQLRRLRVLGELHEQRDEFEQATICYEAAAVLAPDARLGSRLHLQLGQLYEEQLKQMERAAHHYKEALARGPELPIPALRALVRVQEATRDFDGALESLARLEELVRTPEELKQVRLARLEIALRAGLGAEPVMQQARQVLRHYPDHAGAAEALRSRLQSLDARAELETILQGLLREQLSQSAQAGLTGYFALARRWRLDDLSYCIAAVGRWQGMASRDMIAYHDMCGLERRWPTRPIPVELTMGVLPATLSAPFFEVIRRSQEGLATACEALPYTAFTKRRARLNAPTGEPQQLAWRWPELYGLELRDVHMAEQRLPVGAAAFWDGGVRLILDPQWERAALPELTGLLARLGSQLGGISMGIGAWAMLGREAQMFLMSRLVGAMVPGWRKGEVGAKLPAWFKLERFDRWMSREGRDQLAPYVLEMTGRLGHTAMPQQFMLLELAMERMGCVALPDPSRFLPHTSRLGADQGPGHRPWTFLFEPPYARLRQALGIGMP
jgi:tetratricopeptide (TPR) repeat protein